MMCPGMKMSPIVSSTPTVASCPAVTFSVKCEYGARSGSRLPSLSTSGSIEMST